LQADSVDTTKIKTDSVTTPKIITAAVETAKLATDAVTTAKIINAAVETSKLATDSVVTAKIINGAVDTNKLATDAVTTAKLINSAVDTSKIATDAVDTAKILYHDARLRSLSIGNGNTLAGSAALFVNGNTGIGGNIPGAKLNVNTGTNENVGYKSNASNASLQWVNDANSAYNSGRIYANPLLINPGGDGNVGIGTSSPGAVLDVAGAAQFGTAPTKSTFSATGALSIDTQASLQLGTTFYVGNNFVGVSTTSSLIGRATYDWVGNSQSLFQVVSNTSRANIAIVGQASAEFTMWDLGSAANVGAFRISTDAGITTLEARADSLLSTPYTFLYLNHSTGNVGIGVTPTLGLLHLDKGTGVGQVTLDGSTGGCLMIRDTDDGGWTECDALDGVMTCSIDADGVCD